jgi:hypothetical protein
MVQAVAGGFFFRGHERPGSPAPRQRHADVRPAPLMPSRERKHAGGQFMRAPAYCRYALSRNGNALRISAMAIYSGLGVGFADWAGGLRREACRHRPLIARCEPERQQQNCSADICKDSLQPISPGQYSQDKRLPMHSSESLAYYQGRRQRLQRNKRPARADVLPHPPRVSRAGGMSIMAPPLVCRARGGFSMGLCRFRRDNFGAFR